MHIAAFLMIIAITGLAGCTPSPLERHFGESVRQMQANQRYVPADAAPRPLGNGPLDPAKAGAVLDAYRSDVARPEEVTDEIRIRVLGR